MRKILAVSSVVLLLGAGAAIFFLTPNRGMESTLSPDAARDFNLEQVSSPKPAPARQVVSAPKTTSPLPQYSTALKPEALPAESSVVRWVRENKMFQGLMESPVRYIAKKTLLGKPGDFQAFLRDPRRTRNYIEHPLIRGVLDNPVLLRSFLSQPAVVSGFLSSPAMKDRQAVVALASSPLLKQILKGRGVEAVVEDTAFLQQVLMNPQVTSWLAANPTAIGALGNSWPGMAKALGSASALKKGAF